MKPIVEPFCIRAATWPAAISRSLVLELFALAGFVLLIAVHIWG